MGMVYSTVNLSVSLAEWKHAKHTEPSLISAVNVCLSALIQSQPRLTAVKIALCDLKARMRELAFADSNGDYGHSKSATTGSVRSYDTLKENDSEGRLAVNVSSHRAQDRDEVVYTDSIEQLFGGVIELTDDSPRRLCHRY